MRSLGAEPGAFWTWLVVQIALVALAGIAASPWLGPKVLWLVVAVAPATGWLALLAARPRTAGARQAHAGVAGAPSRPGALVPPTLQPTPTLDQAPQGHCLPAASQPLESEDRFRIVFQHCLEGILTLQPGGTVLSCNPAAAGILGRDADNLLHTNLAQWITPKPAALGAKAAPFPPGSYETVAQRADGKPIPLEMTVAASRVDGEPQLVAIIRDATERKATQDRLAFLANYDSLTGLPNRALFRDRLDGAMKRATRNGTEMGLMFLDLDRFKDINDSLGHAAGDLLLQSVAQTLTSCLRDVDSVARYAEQGSTAEAASIADTGGDDFTLARLGGDEFTIIVESIKGPECAAMIARRILDALTHPFMVESHQIYISSSIGISLYPQDDTDLDGLIRHTDMAMYRSKATGRGTYSFYSTDMSADAAARLSLEASLRHALERNEFVLHYQPKADLRTGQVTGVEALIRWNRPGEGMVPPDRFITMLEDTGMILPVGAWVIRTACAELASWDRLGLPPLSLAVNLSARQFRHQHLIQLIADTLLDTGIDPHRLELELTESQLMEDSSVSRAMLASLAELGVKVAIDDFGTGHSSLSYLKRFNIDTLKIDRSFVREITNSEEDHAIATAVVALGHSLDLKIVAEGVETLHQADCLRALGCDEIQGYLLSRPLPAAQLIEWLRGYPSTRTLLKASSARVSAPMPLLSADWIESTQAADLTA